MLVGNPRCLRSHVIPEQEAAEDNIVLPILMGVDACKLETDLSLVIGRCVCGILLLLLDLLPTSL
jgi:hypothetical protein